MFVREAALPYKELDGYMLNLKSCLASVRKTHNIVGRALEGGVFLCVYVSLLMS